MNLKAIEWILRIGVAGEFIGHGLLAFAVKQSWIPYLTVVGFSPETSAALMPFIGMLDCVLALLVLLRPVRIALLWMTFWAFATALIRPIAGDSLLDFVERSANWAAPLALLMMRGWPVSLREWFR